MIENFISTFGYTAIFVLMTAESALIPIPSEVTMAFAGFAAGLGLFNFWLVILIGAAGNLFGSVISFILGRYLGEQIIRDLIKKWGKWLFIREEEFDKSLIWFRKYGQSIAFFSRVLPVIRTFISLPAGIANMNLTIFSVFTFAGSLIWSWFLAFLGLKLGQNWQVIDPYFRKFQYLIVILCVIGFAYFVKLHLKRRKSK